MKKKSSTFFIKFDDVQGPLITKCHTSSKFTAEELEIIKKNAFPDSHSPSSVGVIFFTFRSNQNFCFTAFCSQPNSHSKRGFFQFSIVISTKIPFPVLFERLLTSAFRQKGFRPSEIYLLISSFVDKWDSFFEQEDNDIELPFFDGTAKFEQNNAVSTSELLNFNNFENVFLANFHFLGSKLSSELQCSSDKIFEIWEALICDTPILVYGKNPQKASRAVFAIASLLFPERLCRVQPFISVSDPRFFQEMEHPSGIIGCSNPLALNFEKNFGLVFKAGFAESSYKSFDEQTVRMKIFSQMEKLRRGIESLVVSEMEDIWMGKISSEKVLGMLDDVGISIRTGKSEFVKRIVRSSLFNRIRSSSSLNIKS